MKNLLIITFLVLFSSVIYGQVGINTDTPDASSILDVYSTSKGVLFPRVNITDKTLKGPITAVPKDGLLVYNSGTVLNKSLYSWDSAANSGTGGWNQQLYFKETPKVATIGLINDVSKLNNRDPGHDDYLVNGPAANNYNIITSGYIPGLSFRLGTTVLQPYDTSSGSGSHWDIIVGPGVYKIEISYLLNAPTPDAGRGTALSGTYWNMGYYSDLYVQPYNPAANTVSAFSFYERTEGSTLSKLSPEEHRVTFQHIFSSANNTEYLSLTLKLGRKTGSSHLDLVNVLASGTIIKLIKLK
ncbi:hypothetical protein NZ698_16865 [Chryseobacterium sp. PBS4-4]|uniref:Uncharacterized protein n=1 Tax=Chryseobacterium edaphi TaxID=2976532 RepID=A0ABT2WA27_9FLAO|nr:hypothetical protein [Chryseobacterium edaphi]MCU7618854.1 hypothetical protein [Chryseobacterium edaphi]